MAALDRTVDEKFVSKLYTRLEHYPYWMSDATCVDSDIDQFSSPEKFIEENCSHCPVINQCLRYAQGKSISAGVFGGKIFSQ